MTKIISAIGHTAPVAGPSRGAMLQQAMAAAAAAYKVEHVAAVAAWRKRRNQDDGTSPPKFDNAEVLARKIAARERAKAGARASQ